MVCSEGLSSRQSQAKSGLATWIIIMAGCPRGAKRRAGVPTHYYATNPRAIGTVGEKSGKIGLCNAKCRGNQPFLGERLPEAVRGLQPTKDLRTEQPPHNLATALAMSAQCGYNAAGRIAVT